MLTVLYGATLVLSAALLFSIQLMFTKMVLPLLGGSAAVWTTCLVFYQAVLLLGYLYAHGAARLAAFRLQVALHLVLLCLSLPLVPVTLAVNWSPPVSGAPTLWLFALLTFSLGAPFFLLSATAPLLQHWFARSGRAGARDPYFLYAASNLGSLVALLSYPLLVEPHLRLMEQREIWANGYRLLCLLILGCAVAVWRDGRHAADQPLPPSPAIPWTTRAWWVLLAFAPSSLLLGVTTYISNEIAPVPLLWVLPLALYLLSFIIVFARRTARWYGAALRLQPFALLPLLFVWSWDIGGGSTALLLLHLVALFLTAVVCHGRLAQQRPAPDRLTEFYLWLSVGGVLGGLFNAVLAPHLFRGITEYPLVMILACGLRPAGAAARMKRDSWMADVRWALVPGILMMGLAGMARSLVGDTTLPPAGPILALAVLSGCVAALCYAVKDRPLRFALSVAAAVGGGSVVPLGRSPLLHAERSFYGVHRVRADPTGRYHNLYHGTTLHGTQALDTARRCEPLTYFSRDGALGEAMAALPAWPGRHVAVTGLGAGTIAVYAKPGEAWTYYEIDAAVERIARDPRYFTYLTECTSGVRVVLGDARLSLARSADHEYGLIVLDAFSSDAVPVHLLTREALALYRSKLAPGGAILFHLSNRHLGLGPVVAALAQDAGLEGRLRYVVMSQKQLAEYKAPSLWAVLAEQESDLGGLAGDPRWWALTRERRLPVWTDDFSNLLSVMFR